MKPQQLKPGNYGAKWNREEHVLAFHLYCRLSFGQMHHRNPQIIELAGLLGRTPDSVAMKLSNFARLDPSLQERDISGLSRGAKGEGLVWKEFIDNPEQLVLESERIRAGLLNVSVEESAGIAVDDLPPAGLEREAVVRVRINHAFFRRRVLAGYNGTCCVTGLAQPELLVASHILPWAECPENRLNPRNGLCLNALHDKAFDRGLMWIDDELVIHFSSRLAAKGKRTGMGLSWLLEFEGQKLILKSKLTPDPRFLRQHRERAERGGGLTHLYPFTP